MNKHPVVVGVKDQQPSAVQFAVEAAKARGVGLRVVHCVDRLVTGDIVAAASAAWRTAGQEILDSAHQLIAEDPSPPEAEYDLTAGSPRDVLKDAAETAALVVVGTDPVGRMDRLFSGKVTEYLAKHSPAPVAIIPESSWQSSGGGVFVALDARSLATGPLRFAFGEASRRDNLLYVVHVVPEDTARNDAEAVRAEIAEVLAGWSSEYPDVRVTHRLLFEDADDGCLRASAEADLLVLGRFKVPAIPGRPAHPVLTQTARRAHCPTIVLPDAWNA